MAKTKSKVEIVFWLDLCKFQKIASDASLCVTAKRQTLRSKMGKKILLVEKNDTIRAFIGTVLANRYEVQGAKGPLDAMTRLQQGFVPHLIVSGEHSAEEADVNLFHLLDISGRFASIPIVVVVNDDQDVPSSVQKRWNGIKDVVSQPFDPQSLFHHLECLF